MAVTEKDYAGGTTPAWCPGCGNFKIKNALVTALAELDLAPEKVLVVTGIGQAPKLPHYMRVNTLNGLHGREVATAAAAKMAAPDLAVIVHGGDGGIYGEGGNHLLHAIRRNPDLTIVVHDNHYYGLTKGQVSPTAALGTVSGVHPEGVGATPLNPLALAVSQSCSFVAQATAALEDHLVATLKAAISHKGLSLINALQPCVTYDKVFTFKYYKDHCVELGDDYDPTDRAAALELALRGSDEIPVGVIYRQERPVYEDVVLQGFDMPLRDRGVDPKRAAGFFGRFR